MIAVALEFLYSIGYTKSDILSEYESKVPRDSRILYRANGNKCFTSKAVYRGISFNKGISAISSMSTFLRLLNIFNITGTGLSRIFIILYDCVSVSNKTEDDELKLISVLVKARDIILKK